MPEDKREKMVSVYNEETGQWGKRAVKPGDPYFRMLDTTTEPKPHSVQAAEEDEEAEEKRE